MCVCWLVAGAAGLVAIHAKSRTTGAHEGCNIETNPGSNRMGTFYTGGGGLGVSPVYPLETMHGVEDSNPDK
jgi:hypothetical protein